MSLRTYSTTLHIYVSHAKIQGWIQNFRNRGRTLRQKKCLGGSEGTPQEIFEFLRPRKCFSSSIWGSFKQGFKKITEVR